MGDTDNKAKKQQINVDYRHWGNVSRAVLNGVIGDYLVEQNNPLAIDMGFYHQGAPLSLPNPELKYSNKIVVLLHGLTNLETIWDINTGENQESVKSTSNVINYGIHLQRDFGFTPLFLRYNTGLPIEENGRQFTQLMAQLISAYPKPIDEIVFVGFSMGGLLMRYAQKNAIEANAPWLTKLTNCFYLGTPHEGSYFERFGHLASSMVRNIPKEYISHWADWIDVRSEGIQDLKHGLAHLRKTEPEYDESHGSCGSFYQHAGHHFISGSLTEESDSVLNKIFGDALVTHGSANPNTAPVGSKFAHFDGVPHVPLAHTERVYQQVKQWIEERGSKTKLIAYHQSEIDFNLTPNVMVLSKEDVELSGLHSDLHSKQEMIAGALDLMAVGYEKTVEAVEKVHLSIAKEPHAILKRVPVVQSVSGVVDMTQVGITEAVYYSVKQGGTLLRAAADLLKK
ncbi:esterase/lipase family protein [Alkalimarinus sediminis]|uniref:Alpha/beta hydrolase n=1 Tax=Alkalimarinus sediminis TaxID=1632866 RepID=A0A9E8HS85_9ALTE|nr:alpha/beta hydrolase [Alkalimarinus sediminis]UZW74834.1 alpha/beta hydrolase [Alkalimarinus sediminis]